MSNTQPNQFPPPKLEPKLLDQVRTALRRKGRKLSTEKEYVGWIQGVR